MQLKYSKTERKDKTQKHYIQIPNVCTIIYSLKKVCAPFKLPLLKKKVLAKMEKIS